MMYNWIYYDETRNNTNGNEAVGLADGDELASRLRIADAWHGCAEQHDGVLIGQSVG